MSELLTVVQGIINRYPDSKNLNDLYTALGRLSKTSSNKSLFTVAIIGAFSRGKSTFINALLEMDVLPTNVLPTTSVATKIQYGKKPSAQLVFKKKKPREVNIEEAKKYIATEEQKTKDLESIQIKIPLAKYKNVIFLDSPGIGSVYPEHKQAAMACVQEADLVIFVISSEPLISEAECEFVAQISNQVQSFIFVNTKIDLYKNWKERFDYNFLALQKKTKVTPLRVFPVSSTEKRNYLQTKNAEKLRLSHFEVFEENFQEILNQELPEIVRPKKDEEIRRTLQNIRDTVEVIYKDAKKERSQHQRKISQAAKRLDAINKVQNLQWIVTQEMDQRREACLRLIKSEGQRLKRELRTYTTDIMLYALQSQINKDLIAKLNRAANQLKTNVNAELNKGLTQLAQKHHILSQLRGQKPLINFSLLGNIHVGTSYTYHPEKDQTGKGALIGGGVGTVVFPIVGTVIGAAIGAAIGKQAKKEPEVDWDGTRNSIAYNTNQEVNRQLNSFRGQFIHQFQNWKESLLDDVARNLAKEQQILTVEKKENQKRYSKSNQFVQQVEKDIKMIDLLLLNTK